MMDAWHSHASLRPRQPRNPQRLSHGPKALTAPRLSHGPKSFPRPQVRLTPRWGSRYDGTPICGQSHDQDEARRIAANNRQICRSSCGGRGSSEQRKRVAEATLSRSRVKQCPTAASRRHGPSKPMLRQQPPYARVLVARVLSEIKLRNNLSK
jgi:hypothetical protein